MEAFTSVAPVTAASRGYSPVVIVLVGLAAMLDFIDRFVFSTANDVITHDLHLSDATIGLLGGTAAAVLYMATIIPFGLLADRGLAARMAAGGIALLSLATASMGAAVGVVSMAASRFGVGLGNAMFAPSASALNAAYSTAERRTTAYGVSYSLAYLGPVIGLAGGGFMVEHIGWRATFAATGLIGLPLAFLLRRFVREPRLPAADVSAEGWRALMRNRPYRDLFLYALTSGVLSYGGNLWIVSFYMRSFGLSAEQSGAICGFGSGLPQIAGVLLGGMAADMIRRRHGLSGAIWFALATSLASTVFGVVQVVTHSLSASIGMLVLASALIGLSEAPTLALTPLIVPAKRWAVSQGMMSLAFVGAGLLLGPPLFGAISDALTPRYGPEALRASLLVASVLSFWPNVHLFTLARRLPRNV